MLLLLSHVSRVWLRVTPQTAAHQAPPSLGFFRQEHWSGLPFPSMHESEKWKWSRSVVSDPQRPHGLQPSRLLHPWDFPGMSTGVGKSSIGLIKPATIVYLTLNTPNHICNTLFFLHEFHLWIYFHLFVHSTVGSVAYVEVLIPGSISGMCNNVDHCLFEILFSPTLYSNTLLCLCLVPQLCPILCDPMDCSPPGSSVHGILQARILEWVAIPFFRVYFWPRGWTQVSCIAGRFFTIWDTRKAQHSPKLPCVILMALQCLSLTALLQCSPFKTLIFKYLSLSPLCTY